MSAIGSLAFRINCGHLLKIQLEIRPLFYSAIAADPFSDTASKTITTTTKEASFPSIMRQKRSSIQTVEISDVQEDGVLVANHVLSGRKDVRYTAVQLRSVDEGNTIFYTCEYGHKWNTNN